MGRRLAAASLFTLVLALAEPVRAEPVDLQLILAVDISGSIDAEEAQLQRDGYVAAIKDERVVAAIKSGYLGRIALAYVQWAGDHFQETVIPWRVIDGMESAKAFSEELEWAGWDTEMWTSISAAIDYGAALFDKSPHNSRRRTLDISGDGANNDGEYITIARDRAVRAGITINGLPIVNGRPSEFGSLPIEHLDWYYEDCVIGGTGAFIIVANGFEDFARAIRRKLILEIAGRQPTNPPGQDGITRPRPIPAASEKRPGCGAGEERIRNFLDF